MSATKTEQAVLQAAYYWSMNPTDREAKRLLFAAVRKDMDAEALRDQRRLLRAERGKIAKEEGK